jgi:hypothetical protein
MGTNSLLQNMARRLGGQPGLNALANTFDFKERLTDLRVALFEAINE